MLLLGKPCLLIILFTIIASCNFLLGKTVALSSSSSPSFNLQEIKDNKHAWIQVYGNDSSNLRTSYTDLLAVNYLSDGKTLDATYWLNVDSKTNVSAAYGQ